MLRLMLCFLVFLLLFIPACEGPQGPVGPQGEKGDPGDPGDPGPGTRIIYKSATTVPSDAEWCLDIPEIDVDDMPMVSVYVSHPELSGVWYEIPFYYEGAPDLGQWCYLVDGHACVYQCGGFYVMVIIVI